MTVTDRREASSAPEQDQDTMLFKALLTDRVCAYHPNLARVLGGIKAAVFFEMLAWWSERSSDGWVFRTREEIENDTAMTRTEQESARKQLTKREAIEEQRRGVPARMNYRINWNKVKALVQNAENLPTGLQETRQQDGGKPANYLVNTDSKDNSSRRGTPAAHNAATYMDRFISQLNQASVPFPENQRGRIAKEFKQLIDDYGANAELLTQIVARMVTRWTGKKKYALSPSQAYLDITGDDPTARRNDDKFVKVGHRRFVRAGDESGTQYKYVDGDYRKIGTDDLGNEFVMNRGRRMIV